MQTGESVEQANVFKAHAIPQGLCENLINALKLLANQQEDGEGLIHSMVDQSRQRKQERSHGRPAGLHQGGQSSRFGELHRGTGTFQVRKPKVSEGGPDVTIRESPVELTLRAEEVNTWKAYIDVNHISPQRWGPPVVDADWYAFCQVLHKCTEGEDWEEMYDSNKGSE